MSRRQDGEGSNDGDVALPPMCFIRLGAADNWASTCLARGEVHYGDSEAPEASARSLDVNALTDCYLTERGVDRRDAVPQAPSRFVIGVADSRQPTADIECRTADRRSRFGLPHGESRQ